MIPHMEEMVTMLPACRADKAWDRRPQDMEHPVQIVPISSRQPSVLRSVSSIWGAAMPALHTRASSPPKVCSAAAVRAAASSGRETSPGMASAADAPLPQFCRQRLRRCPGAAVVYRHTRRPGQTAGRPPLRSPGMPR